MPSGRHGHSAVVSPGAMLVFGGYSAASHNDLWRLDLATFEWAPLEAKGTPPCARWRHTAVVSAPASGFSFDSLLHCKDRVEIPVEF